MEPLNWEFGIRSDRPFEVILSSQRSKPAIQQLRRYKQRLHRSVMPLQLMLPNQPEFWEAGPPIFDPYNSQTERRLTGPFKTKYQLPIVFLGVAFRIVAALLLSLWEELVFASPFVVHTWKCVAGWFTWKRTISILVAWQAVKFLPRMEGATVESVTNRTLAEVSPTYVIMIPSFSLSKLVRSALRL